MSKDKGSSKSSPKGCSLRLSELNKAYLAGFLDGDGSIIFQMIKNPSYKYGFQLRISIGFYQHINKHWFILYLDKTLNKIGIVRKRSDQITT